LTALKPILLVKIIKFSTYAFLVFVVATITMSILLRYREINWKVNHPTYSNDIGKVMQIFSQVGEGNRCYWSEGLQSTGDFSRPYINAITGYVWLDRQQQQRFLKKYRWEAVRSDRSWSPDFAPQLLAHAPQKWLVYTDAQAKIVRNYQGMIYIEKNNGVIYFTLVTAQQKQ